MFTLIMINFNRIIIVICLLFSCLKNTHGNESKSEEEYGNNPLPISTPPSERLSMPTHEWASEDKSLQYRKTRRKARTFKPKRVQDIIKLSDCIALAEKYRRHCKFRSLVPSFLNLYALQMNLTAGYPPDKGWTLAKVDECIELMERHHDEIEYVVNNFINNSLVIFTDVSRAVFLGLFRAKKFMVRTDKQNMYRLSWKNILKRAVITVPEGDQEHIEEVKKLRDCYEALGDQTRLHPGEIALRFAQGMITGIYSVNMHNKKP